MVIPHQNAIDVGSETVLLHRRLQPENVRKIRTHRILDSLSIEPNVRMGAPSESKHTTIKRSRFKARLISAPVRGSVPKIATDKSTRIRRKEKKNPTANARSEPAVDWNSSILAMLLVVCTSPHCLLGRISNSNVTLRQTKNSLFENETIRE